MRNSGPAKRQLKYVEVREYVRSLCADAPAGTPTPSERKLGEQFGVARMTVRQAIDTLVAEGVVERVRGRGTFVAGRRRGVGELRSFGEEMLNRGHVPGARTLVLRREPSGAGVARALMMPAGDPVIHWRRLRTADGDPICVEDVHLHDALLGDFPLDAPPTSLWGMLSEAGLRPTSAQDAVAADIAGEAEAHLLRIGRGAPVLRVARRGLRGDRAVLVMRSVYRADRFTLWLELGTK